MRIPSSLSIAGIQWQVVEVPGLTADEEIHGDCNPNRLVIRIDADLPPTVKEATFMHELLHAVASTVGIQNEEELIEEQFVTRMSDVLYGTIEANRLFHPNGR